MTAFYVGLMPWLVFIVADRSAGVGPSHAAIVGLVVALGIGGVELRSRRFRPLAFLAIVEFSALAIISAQGARSADVWRYDRAFAVGLLAVVFALSLLVAPITASYTRDVVTPRQWTEAPFFHANATLTRSWALVLALVAVSFAVGATFENSLATTLFNWLIPILIVTVSASKVAQPSERDGGPAALRALECLMSDPDDDGVGRGPRRLSW